MAASSADWVCDWDVYLCGLCDCLYQTVPAGIDVVAHYVGRDQLDTVLLKTTPIRLAIRPLGYTGVVRNRMIFNGHLYD